MTGILTQSKQDAIEAIKKGIWVYFFLLIFEGALRKWFLPGLATPLLVVRDPVAIWLIYMAWKNRMLPFSFPVIGVAIVSILALFLTLFLGHGNVVVMLYGLRIFLIQFPVIIVIGAVFTKEDVIKMGKAVLWISIPMTVLVAMQFYSPQSAWVNLGVGGDEKGAGFSGSMGFFRPPGTFSFTNGNTLFFSMVANFVCYFIVENKKVSKNLLIVSSIFLLFAIPMAISRALLFHTLIFLFFTVISVLNRPSHFKSIIIGIVACLCMLVLLNNLPMFQTSVKAFTQRFELANESEGGVESVLVDRYLGGLVGSLTQKGDAPFWGHGLGLGTNAGSTLLTGERQFLITEGEWGRVIGEFGAFLGLLVIFFRLELSLELMIKSISKLSKGNILPFILLSFTLLLLPQGQWAQPTALGFAVLITGLTLASLNDRE